jgi:hypothetical protein
MLLLLLLGQRRLGLPFSLLLPLLLHQWWWRQPPRWLMLLLPLFDARAGLLLLLSRQGLLLLQLRPLLAPMLLLLPCQGLLLWPQARPRRRWLLLLLLQRHPYLLLWQCNSG